MNDQNLLLLLAALVARGGGKLTVGAHEIAALYSREVTFTHLPHDGSVEITVPMPPRAPIDAEFRVLEDQRR